MLDMKDNVNIDGDFIKDLRSRLGVSRPKFASMLGCGTRSVVKWEREGVTPSRLMKPHILKLNEQVEIYGVELVKQKFIKPKDFV